jgi:hypothetical protein
MEMKIIQRVDCAMSKERTDSAITSSLIKMVLFRPKESDRAAMGIEPTKLPKAKTEAKEAVMPYRTPTSVVPYVTRKDTKV